MKKIVGIIGSGNIGRDPFDKGSWSGSSYFFFTACSKAGLLYRAFGVEAPVHVRIPLMLNNFAFKKSVWREKFYLDTGYYDALTKKVQNSLLSSDYRYDFVQIGAIYDVPKLVKGKAKCYSYHDGNLAQNVKSPYFNKEIPRRVVDRALEYEGRVYRGLDKIFTMSEYLRRSFIEDFGISPDKVVCIGAGINLENVPPSIPDKDYSRKSILFIGVDFYRKGGLQLLQAFRLARESIRDATLTIVGPPQLQIDDDLAKGVKYLGFLSKSDPAHRILFENSLREATLFVMPSLYEPFGIAPLEAMVNEIPCILTNQWALPEMVTQGETGELVECGDVDGLAERMIEILNSPDKLRSMGQLARKIVLQEFTWKRVVERLSAAID